MGKTLVFIFFTALCLNDSVWAEETSMVVQVGHGDVVRGIVAGGGRVITASMDGTIKIWEQNTGRLFRTLNAHAGGVLCVTLSDDGRHIISGGQDRVVRMWDAMTGQMVRAWSGLPDVVRSVSVQGDLVAVGVEDGTIVVGSLTNGQEIRRYAGHAHGTLSIYFGKDGQLVSGGADALVKVWAPDGALMRELSGHEGAVNAVLMLGDGRVVSGGDDGILRLWAADGTARWSVRGHDQPVVSVGASLDGKIVYTGSWDGTLGIWASADGAQKEKITYGEAVGAVYGVFDGVYGAGGDRQARLFDLSGQVVQTYSGAGIWVFGVAVDAQNIYAASGHGDGGVRLWDVVSGRQLRKLDAHTAAVVDVALSADGSMVLSGGGDGLVKAWNVATGEEHYAISEHEAWVYAVALSADGRLGASVSADEMAVVFDAKSGEVLHVIEEHSGEVTGVAFSGDASRLVTSSGDGTVLVWDVNANAAITRLEGHAGWVFDADISGDGQTVVSGSEDGTLKVWNVASGNVVHQLEVGASVTQVVLVGQVCVAGTIKGEVIRLQISDGQVVSRVTGHSQRIAGLASGKGRIYSGSRDGRFVVRNGEGQAIVDLMGFVTGDWLATTREGYFNCSINGSRYVMWRVGNALFPFEQYENMYRKPGEIQNRLKAQTPGTSKEAAPAKAGQPPHIRLTSPTSGSATIDTVVTAQVEVGGKGAHTLEVKINGRPVDAVVEGQASPLTAHIPIKQGPNRISIVAVNASGLQSDPDTVTVVRMTTAAPGSVSGVFANLDALKRAMHERNRSGDDAPVDAASAEAAKGTLWILTVGVGKHSNPRFNLRFPPMDATAIADAFRERSEGLYRDIRSVILVDEQSTTPNILSQLEALSKEIGPDDVMVMFVAGHGMRHSQNDNEYYFITHDGNPSKPEETAFSWAYFQKILAELPARNVLLFADTCHSGDIIKPGSRLASADEMAESLVKDAGVMVFVSSQGSEYSLESKAWGHGAFTYALLEALEGKANYEPDGIISMAEIQLYVPIRVRKLTKNRQHPRIPRLENFDPEMPLVNVK